MSASVQSSGLQIRPDWLATVTETPLMADLPVIDAHHHLYDRPGLRYLFDDVLADFDSGHNVVATVVVQARAMLRERGPEHMKAVGETEFVNGIAAMSASGQYGSVQLCAGIVGYADLRQVDTLDEVLEAHIDAAGGRTVDGGRFCGIRQPLAWHADAGWVNPAYAITEGMMGSEAFRAGFARLTKLGLSFDAWLYHHQMDELTALATAFPETPIVLNHCGGFLGKDVSPHAATAAFGQWQRSLSALARCENVKVKLSGMGQGFWGFGFDEQPAAPTSVQLAQAWRPWVETCIERFGATRCMVGSNFPVDKRSFSYGVWLNAMKRLFAQASSNEQAHVFAQTAAGFYGLQVPRLSEQRVHAELGF